jgi:5-methylcytosine-specific restriction protein A
LRINKSGEKSPFWVGGETTYRGKGWVEARLSAVERDKGVCQSCGKVVGRSISVHHIKPFRLFDNIKDANALDNLICLCQSCHMRIEYAK